jgi:hypothetical protein
MRDHPIFSVILGLVPRTHGAPARASVGSHARATDKWVLGTSPRMTGLGVAAALSLAACGPAPEPAAPTPAEKVSAVSPASDAEASVPVVLTTDQLRRVCRAGLAAIHGQGVADIQIDGLEGQIVNASWRAPVDGGRRTAQCRVDGDLVTWKPGDASTPEQNRWMNQSGDPVARFVLDGDAITINTTLPDGSTAAETYSVAAEQEAR